MCTDNRCLLPIHGHLTFYAAAVTAACCCCCCCCCCLLSLRTAAQGLLQELTETISDEHQRKGLANMLASLPPDERKGTLAKLKEMTPVTKRSSLVIYI